jgi:hypothetical protein
MIVITTSLTLCERPNLHQSSILAENMRLNWAIGAFPEVLGGPS